jgi:hypothetical protein
LPPLPLSKHEGKREGAFKGERKAQVSARYGVVSDMKCQKLMAFGVTRSQHYLYGLCIGSCLDIYSYNYIWKKDENILYALRFIISGMVVRGGSTRSSDYLFTILISCVIIDIISCICYDSHTGNLYKGMNKAIMCYTTSQEGSLVDGFFAGFQKAVSSC